ncbi:MAG TPA: 1,4-alpha-glucan branching protein domain-containing protein, partial [Candidatus Eisenbacteria bacterium]|nr:1,4-alpha-glucan branching protein domain-containing protein [Candidatus Eisenbacteria bacterium]
MAKGYLALVLHAHLPFVRHPEDPTVMEERWLYDAIVGTYLPLIQLFEGLVADRVPGRATVSLSAPLLNMLTDPLLMERAAEHLDTLIELAGKEVARNRNEPHYRRLSEMYRSRFENMRVTWRAHDGNLVRAFARLQEAGSLELITTTATHAFFPLLAGNRAAIRAQVHVAADLYEAQLGRRPRGMWLGECGYVPGVDDVFAEAGIRYFFVDSHAVRKADRRPAYDVYAPIYCPSGVAAFGRDLESSAQVWSAQEGYPGDPHYRDFYRDIGFDLPLEIIGPYVHPEGHRLYTGFKYHAVTHAELHDKWVYDPEVARARAGEHAADFRQRRAEQAARVGVGMDRPPLMLSPYDAELFGHWWFEGPLFLGDLFRQLHFDQSEIETMTAGDYLDRHPVNQMATPSASSWGEGGYNAYWLDESNAWIYQHHHVAAERMVELALRFRDASDLELRALRQAARELLLLQSSDWAFIMKTGTTVPYARRRVHEHVTRFLRLYQELNVGSIDVARLAEVESIDNAFPDVDPYLFADAESLPRPGGPPLRFQPPALPPLRVLFVASEVSPFGRTGGLGDVVGSLPKALRERGIDVRVVMPLYGGMSWDELQILDGALNVPMGFGDVAARLRMGRLPRSQVPVYFLEHRGYFDRPTLYGPSGAEYGDNIERFAFLSRGALEAALALGFQPDVVHAHDWHTALVPMYMNGDARLGALHQGASLFTIHNLAHQGVGGLEHLGVIGLGPEQFTSRGLEHFGQLNLMKGALYHATMVGTVSPTYAREIQTPAYGFGLDGVLRERGSDLVGILNGIDVDEWNPETDPFLTSRFSVSDLSGKAACKEAFQSEIGLPVRPDVPLFGMVSRLTPQKGVDVLLDILPALARLDLQLVVLGSGDSQLEEGFRRAAEQFPERIRAWIRFDNRLSHRIEAASDFFLMPSRFEPCGLSQLYSLRYGTLPIVRATGGLMDTVLNYDERKG